MAHKTLIGGTAYEISGGKTLIDGTAYKIKNGKTMTDGTVHDIDFNICYVSFAFWMSDDLLDALKSGTRIKDFMQDARGIQLLDGEYYPDISDTPEADYTYITINGVNYTTGGAFNIPVVKGSYIHFYIESDKSDENGYLKVFRKDGTNEKLAEGKFHYDLLVDSDLDIMMDHDNDFANWTYRQWWMAQVFYR